MVGLECIWTVKERDTRTGLYIPRRTVKNNWTSYGLSQLASAIQGGYVPPSSLVIDTDSASISATIAVGVSSVSLSKRIDLAGDTQLILGAGLVTQETVSFSAAPVLSGGVWVYTLTAPTTQIHTMNDPALRQVAVGDTLTSVVAEMEYDSVNAPSQRLVSGSGYQNGAGVWVIQFFLNGAQALGNLMTLGLSESPTVGAGNLHNHFVLGFVHSSGVDLELDGSLTLVNV